MRIPNALSMATLMLCLLCAGGALAEKIENEPGYLDLEWIAIPDDASEIQDIDLGPILLDLAADADEKGDDALVQALAMIHSIRVKAFSIEDGGDQEVKKSVDKVAAKLKTGDWKRLIYVKDGDETVSVNTKYEGQDLVGLMIVSYEAGDSVAFVNVVGDLDLSALLRLAKDIDHDSIEDMLEELDEIEGIEIDRDDGDI